MKDIKDQLRIHSPIKNGPLAKMKEIAEIYKYLNSLGLTEAQKLRPFGVAFLTRMADFKKGAAGVPTQVADTTNSEPAATVISPQQVAELGKEETK